MIFKKRRKQSLKHTAINKLNPEEEQTQTPEINFSEAAQRALNKGFPPEDVRDATSSAIHDEKSGFYD